MLELCSLHDDEVLMDGQTNGWNSKFEGHKTEKKNTESSDFCNSLHELLSIIEFLLELSENVTLCVFISK